MAIGAKGALFRIGNRPTFLVSPIERAATADLFDLFTHVVPVTGQHTRDQLIAVGGEGTILISDDGGAIWVAPMGPTVGEDLFAARFSCADVELGLVVGQSGTILRTLSGGTEWERLTPATAEDLNDVAIVSQDSDSAIAVGDGGMLLRSPDAGLTWKPVDSGVDADLLSVHFGWCVYGKTSRVGVAVGTSGTVLVSLDAGISWTPRDLGLTENLRQVAVEWFEETHAAIILGERRILRVGLENNTVQTTLQTDEELRSFSESRPIVIGNGVLYAEKPCG